YNSAGGSSGSRPKIAIDNIQLVAAGNACITPATSPLSLTFTNITATSVQGSFSASIPAADEYLVVATIYGSLSSYPVDGNIYKLVPINQYRALFDTGESEEMIFQMYYNSKKGEFSDYYGHIMTYYLTNPYTDRGNLSLAVPKSKILEIYPDYARDKSDKRVAEFFQSIDFSVGGSELRPVFPDPLQNGERAIMFAKFRKVKDRSYNLMDAPVPIFRYADILLLKAEADARLGRVTEALENLNKIRSRAGIPVFTRDDAPTVIEEVLEERRRELIGEFHRVYDLVRLGRLHEFNSFVTAQGEKDGAGFFPVSDEAFANNPNMEQTYYWQFNQ
ncbi:MAG: RagB/SusD family nutrient uptake outer membrane protein, partial [Pedobacter sp.]